MVFGPIGKTRWPPRPLIDWDIFDFSSVTAIWNSTKLGREQDLNVLCQGCVSSADWKNKLATRLLNGWHSRLLLWNRWIEFNKIHRNQDLYVFYHVCVFRVDRRNKKAAPACNWLRHFRFFLWNHWMEFNKIWQDARSQRPLIKLCLSGRSEEQDGRPASDLLRHFRLLLCDRWTEFNETWQEAKFQRPLPSLCYSTKLDRKQDINVLYKVFFRADQKNKMAAPASDWLRHFRLLLWTEFNKTWQEIRYVNAIFQVCVFSGWSEKYCTQVYDMWPLGLLFVY